MSYSECVCKTYMGAFLYPLSLKCHYCYLHQYDYHMYCVLNAYSALTLLVGQQERHLACKKTEWLGAGVVICME